MAAARLRRQAAGSGLFDEIVVKDDQWVKSKLPDVWRATRTDAGSRGYGFWRWKPHLLSQALQDAREKGNGVVYLDAGCELNLNQASVERFKAYFRLAEVRGLVAMTLKDPLSQWCKKEVLDFFHLSDFQSRDTPITQAGVLVLTPTVECLALVEEWASCADVNDGYLFNDELDPSAQQMQFSSHRHDQSVFTCLMSKHGMTGIPDETWFGPAWVPNGCAFPIWAIRNRFPFSRKPGTVGATLIGAAKQLRNCCRIPKDETASND